MFYTSFLLIYAIFFISFFVLCAAIRDEGKILRFLLAFVYLVTGILLTFLLIAEIREPSEGANLGLGFMMLVTIFISFSGILAAGIIYLAKRVGNRSSR